MAGLPDLGDLRLDDWVSSEYPIQNLTDPTVVKLLSKTETKILVIMRGVPGTGKSTLARHLMEKLNVDCICSADDYFMKSGSYTFDPKQLGSAHSECQAKAKAYCDQGESIVIIDNTNVVFRDFWYYVKLANDSGYIVFMVTPTSQFISSAAQLAKRNKHGVLADKIQQRLNKFEDILPLYFAWFFGKKTSARLSTIKDDELEKLKGEKWLAFSGEKKTVHVTSLYLARVASEPDKKARAQELLKEVGKWQKFKVDAIVVTERTVSARVQLTPEAKRLYDNDGPIENDILSNKPGYNDLPKGHAAHITLGTALGIQSAQARSDMILAQLCTIDRQIKREERGNITYYREHKLAVIVLDRPRILDGMFAGYYSSYISRSH